MGTPDKTTKIVQTSIATIDPWIRFTMRDRKRMMASDAMETARAGQLIVAMCSKRSRKRGMKALGISPVFNPRKSLIWVDAMSKTLCH